jgi:hypothetical protein
MQRHGDDEQFGCSGRHQLGNCRRKKQAEPRGSRVNPVVFKGMNGAAQAAIVGCESNGALKGRRGKSAGTAKMRGKDAFDGRLVKNVAAAEAGGTVVGGYFSPAGITDWNGRELRQRRAAEGAGARKESGTDCVQRTSKNARNGAPTGCLRKWTVDRQ